MKSEHRFFSQGIGKISGAVCRLRWLPALFVALVLLPILGCQQFAGKPKALSPPPSGAELFKSKCGKCHDPALALKQYRSKKVWRATILRMKNLHHADISKEEVDRLVRYHVQRQEQEATLFRQKCQKCHPGKVFLEQNLTPDQARAIIKRMQLKAGNTIEDKDIEIIVRYHMRSQRAAVQASLNAILGKAPKGQTAMQKGRELFVEKCSSCHSPARALSVFKDPQAWAQTIKRMQYYSKGAITDKEAKELVDFHVAQQQKEIDAFRHTCTRCHSDARINSRSLSEKQWRAVIKRMQKKAPRLISDEKVNLIAAYFHRRELTMARIFYDKCQLCHYDNKGKALPSGSFRQMDGLIAQVNRELGPGVQVKDVNNLLSLHVQRQKRVMRLYETNCNRCHPGGVPKKGKVARNNPAVRTRAEWISFIATLQGQELSKGLQNAINNQIQFHIAKH